MMLKTCLHIVARLMLGGTHSLCHTSVSDDGGSNIFETSVNFYQHTVRNVPEYSDFHQGQLFTKEVPM
jgi:hypothetical protein